MDLKEKILKEPKPLSEDQKNAVLSDSKYLKIIAGAGAGKTETLTRRIIYLILCKDVKPSEIVAFTFTEKAAQSMKSRIYQRLSYLGQDELLKKIGEMYVGTIHAYCLRLLEDHFGYGDYNIFDENQERAFIMRYGWSLGLGNGGSYSNNCDIFLNSLNAVYNELIDREKLSKKVPDFYKMLIRYEEHLHKHHRLTFNQLMYETVKKIEERNEMLKDVQYLIVDEFQDVSNAQMRLIHQIGQNSSVFVVGDPRQTIYQWRGSNEKYFHEFDSYFENPETIEIRENRRSCKNIVEVSNLFADTFDEVDYTHLTPTRDREGHLYKFSTSDDKDEANKIANEIDRLVKSGKCNYKDFGILLRSVTTSAEPLIEKFKEMKVPYLVGGKVGLFKRDEAQSLGMLFSWLSDGGFWVTNPYDWRQRIEGDPLLEEAIILWESATGLKLDSKIKEQITNWKNSVENNGYKSFKEVYYDLLCLLKYRELDVADKLHAALMANLGKFSSLLGDFEVANRLGGKPPHWKTDLKNLCWFMNSYASKSYEEQEVDNVGKSDAVEIMTVHQAKGLEWPTVFIPCLVSKRFPSMKAGSKRNWMIHRDLFDATRYEGGIEDEKRLFYVAISRAKDCLVLSYFDSRAQSVFLDDLDKTRLVKGVSPSFHLEYESPETLESEDIQTFAPTELIDYMKCPHHYRLNKMWQYLQFTNNPTMGYGQTLHFCLRYAADLIKKEGYSPISAAATAVDKKFFLPFAGESLRERVKNSAKKSMIKFSTEREDDMKNIEEVETRIEFPLKNATIVGKVDVILKDHEAYESRDYKTSEDVITESDSAFQLRLYSLGLRESGWNINKGSIAYIKESEIKDIDVGSVEISKSKKAAEDIIDRINKGDFKACPSEFCGKCEYLKICKWGKKDA